MPNTSINPNNNNNSSGAMMGGGPNTGRFQFNMVAQQQPTSKPQLDSLSPSPFDGSLRPCGSGGFSIDSTASAGKKKRGRPRKYSPDGNIALGLAPTQISPASAPAAGPHGESSGTMSSDPPAKKNRGRPPGSGKKQLDALGNCHSAIRILYFLMMCIVVISVWCLICGVQELVELGSRLML